MKRLEQVWLELGSAARVLKRNPGFSAVVILTLALGIGANTALFSVVKAVILRPLPFPDSGRIYSLWERNPKRGFDHERVSPPNLDEWRRENRSFDELGYLSGNWSEGGLFNLVGPDGITKVKSVYASSSLFNVLGVPPAMGRTFLAEEDKSQGPMVAVISHDLWLDRFGGSPDILGKRITADTYGRRDYEIVGVMPAGFDFPAHCQLWLPAGWNGLPMERRGGHWLDVIGRLKPGIAAGAARADLDAIQARIEKEHPEFLTGSGVAMVPLLDQIIGGKFHSALLVLWCAVGCVLAIACANVAHLFLARASERRREWAIRLALGAGRWRLVRAGIYESVFLALLGGLLGMAPARWGLAMFIAAYGDLLPRAREVGLDWGVFGFAVLIALVAGIVPGAAPAWFSSKSDPNDALKLSSHVSFSGAGRNWVRKALVIGETCLSLTLLAGTIMTVRNLERIAAIDRGFRVDHLIAADLDFSVSGFTTWIRPTATRPQVTLKNVMDRLRSLPRVESIAAVSALARTVTGPSTQTVLIENRAEESANGQWTAYFQGISPDFFRVLGAPLLKGRIFSEGDTIESPRVAIVNETFAKRYLGGRDPVGQRLALGDSRRPYRPAGANSTNAQSWVEIVGVVRDIRKLGSAALVFPDVYVPYWQWPMQSPTLLVRSPGETQGIAAAIRAETKAAAPSLPAPAIQAMDEIIAESNLQPRLMASLFGLFGGLALLLCLVGIYGVASYTVSLREREMGVRIALGAQLSDIAGLVLGGGAALALCGIAVGLLCAAALSRVMASVFYEAGQLDIASLGMAAAAMAAATLLACWLPARRATKVDPMIALRTD